MCVCACVCTGDNSKTAWPIVTIFRTQGLADIYLCRFFAFFDILIWWRHFWPFMPKRFSTVKATFLKQFLKTNAFIVSQGTPTTGQDCSPLLWIFLWKKSIFLNLKNHTFYKKLSDQKLADIQITLDCPSNNMYNLMVFYSSLPVKSRSKFNFSQFKKMQYFKT